MPFSTAIRLAAAFCVFGLAAIANAQADVLADIRAKGEIVIGVREEAFPFGYRNEKGELQGLEIDLARDIAERVGVKFKPFVINPTSRLQFIELELNDVLIGTLAVTDRRREQVRLVEPYYYATSISLLVPAKNGAVKLADVRGKPACMLKGAYFKEAVSEHPAGLKALTVRTMDEARAWLSAGRCDTIAAETAKLVQLQRVRKDLDGSTLIPVDIPPLPWAIAINKKMAGSDFEQLLSDAVADWHKSGKLKALEKQWLGRNTEWVLRQHEDNQ